MRKIIILSICLLRMMFPVFAEPLKGGVSMEDSLPGSFYGTWRVLAKIDKQSGDINFKPKTVDIWNLSRAGDVINLNNPFTGASSSVKMDYVDGNMIRFTKAGDYDGNKKLTDTVDLKLNGNTFTGINTLVLETYSALDNTLIKKDTALYILKGEKISGTSITEK